MSALPEAKLAREAEIGYVTVATSTDYDSWREHHGPVDVGEVLKVLKQNVEASNEVSLRLFDVLQEVLGKRVGKDGGVSGLEGSMKMAIMTQPQFVPETVKESIRFILDWYGEEQ